LIGPPGSGKGTVSGIARQNGVTVISTRELLEKQPDTQQPMKDGVLLPDQRVIELVEGEIIRVQRSSQPIMIDTPRSLVQAKSLWKFLTIHQYHISSILLMIDPEEAIKRILNRGQEQRSDGQVVTRDDDNIQTATKRMEDYNSYGPQIWSWLVKHSDTYEIDNMRPREQMSMHTNRVIRLALSCTQEVHVPRHHKFQFTHF
jgi:adenylate kinase family enzyme